MAKCMKVGCESYGAVQGLQGYVDVILCEEDKCRLVTKIRPFFIQLERSTCQFYIELSRIIGNTGNGDAAKLASEARISDIEKIADAITAWLQEAP